MGYRKFVLTFATIFLQLFCILPVFTQRLVRQQVQICNTPDNHTGVCVTRSYCPSIATLYAQNNKSPRLVWYLKGLQRNCGTRSVNGDPVVCCQEVYNEQQITTTELSIIRPIITTTQPPIQISTAPPFQTKRPPVVFPSWDVDPKSRLSAYCLSPDLKDGNCKILTNCPSLLDMYNQNRNNPEFNEFLKQSNVICDRQFGYVCCPSEDNGSNDKGKLIQSTTSSSFDKTNLFINRLPSVEDGCGQSNNTFKKIVGGADAKLGAWPWIALLGYEEFNQVEFKCGGTLITQKHVLTAAHCILRNLVLVRLGEHDLRTNSETKHLDLALSRAERYPSYSRQDSFADIGMIYLKDIVQFTEFIKPVCLPKSPTLRSKSYVDYSPFVIGWGKTQENGQSASVLQELQISIYNNSVCIESYSKKGKYRSYRQFGESVLCAGVYGGGKDTCQGDSGGPLMIPENVDGTYYFYEIGVVSYGIGCARADVPGVYTSVQYYMDWIEEKVSQTEI